MNHSSTRTILRPRAAPTDIRLTVVSGPQAGASTVGKKLTLGRSRLADVTVTDVTVSEFHVEVSGHADGIEIRDLDSWNGTYFAGARVSLVVVPGGTVLTLGESMIRVDVVGDSPAASATTRDSFRSLLGRSAPMRELFEMCERLAPTELSVFIEGPTGSGKELVARALHDSSARAKGPFVVIDCAALPASLAESVLFGHAPGAFTGAVERREGAFEAANGGTVFIDEVGDLPLDLQPKLLRVLEQRQVTRLGENKPRALSVRLVSATWRDLRRMVNRGLFRDDLYFRLAQTRLLLPSLAERREDVEQLAVEFLRRLPRNAPCARSLSREALAELARRDYPGNVRELKSVVERAAYMCDGPVIRPHDLAFERILERHRETMDADEEGAEVPEFKGAKRTVVDDFERQYLERLMTKTSGNIAMAAGLAGIERHYLRSLLKKHGLHTRD